MESFKTVALLTDFGARDGYAGIMKGVIWGIAPGTQVADISHEVTPQDIFEGALTLKRAVPYFPPGTVFVAVIDPGVGTLRRPLAARLGERYFVGPDNGLLTLWLELVEGSGAETRFVHLNRPEYWLPEVSRGFHGRDIFAPAAAHLARGVSLDQLGDPITDPVRLAVPRPQPVSGGWVGQVIHIDHFGNAATNIDRKCLLDGEVSAVSVAGRTIEGIVQAFGDREPGEFVALVDSDGYLAVSAVNGSAARSLSIRAGDPVRVYLRRQDE